MLLLLDLVNSTNLLPSEMDLSLTSLAAQRLPLTDLVPDLDLEARSGVTHRPRPRELDRRDHLIDEPDESSLHRVESGCKPVVLVPSGCK